MRDRAISAKFLAHRVYMQDTLLNSQKFFLFPKMEAILAANTIFLLGRFVFAWQKQSLCLPSDPLVFLFCRDEGKGFSPEEIFERFSPGGFSAEGFSPGS